MTVGQHVSPGARAPVAPPSEFSLKISLQNGKMALAQQEIRKCKSWSKRPSYKHVSQLREKKD